MAFSVGSVTAQLKARTDDFTRQFNRAEKSLERFGSKGKRLEDQMRSLERTKAGVNRKLQEAEERYSKNSRVIEYFNRKLRESSDRTSDLITKKTQLKVKLFNIGKKHGEQSKQYASVNRELTKNINLIERSTRQTTDYETKITKLNTAQNRLTKTKEGLNGRLAGLNDRIATQRMRMDELGKRFDINTIKTKLMTGAKAGLLKVMMALKTIGIAGLLIGFAALAGGIFGALKTAGQFQTAMLEVKAISNATGEEYKSLTKQSKDLGRTTAFTAKQVAEAQKYQAMAGYSVNQILQATPGLLALAAAGNTDLATTSDIVTDAMTAFGMKAEETTKFADLLAQTSRSSNTNVAIMGETFKYAAPLAGTFGVAAEDVALALGLMANAGIKGSMAGTALRSGFSRLAKPTKDASEAMRKLGVKVFDARGEMKPFGDILVELRTKFSKLSPQMQASSAKAMFGEEAFAGWLAVINASPEAFDKLRHATLNYDGAAQQMADTMQSGWQGAINRMQSAWEGLLISFGESGILDLVTVGIEKLANVMVILGTKVETWLKPRMNAMLEDLRTWYNTGGKEAIKGFLKEGWDMFVDAIKWFINDVWPSLRDALGGFMEWIKSEDGKQAMSDMGGVIRSIGDALMFVFDQAGRAKRGLDDFNNSQVGGNAVQGIKNFNALKPINDYNNWVMNKIRGRKNGGPVKAGNLYEVGEGNKAEMLKMNGKQYMIPGNNGQVLNQDQMKDKGDSKTVNVYNYYAGKPNRFTSNSLAFA